MHLHRHRRTAAHADAQRGRVGCAWPGACSIAWYIVGTPSRTVTLVARDDRQRLGRLEAREQRQARAVRDRRVHPARLPERVKQRQRPEDHVLLVDADQRLRRHRAVLDQVVVRELGALRRARRAARVEDHGGVGALARLVGLRARRAHDELLELAGLDEDRLRPGLERAALGRLMKVMPSEETLRTTITQVERHLTSLKEHVHRHHDAARAQDAVVHDREIGNVRQHDPDPVPRREAAIFQQPCDSAWHPR